MIEQGTEEWRRERLGCFTSSTVKQLMTKGRGNKPSQTRTNFLWSLVAERLTGEPNNSPETYAMSRGKALEPEARVAYTMATGQDVETVGFVPHPALPNCGCSPDGLVGTDGLIEIKCPITEWRHAAALAGEIERDEYEKQRQFQLWVTGRAWLDCVSFHPKFKATQQIAIQRIEPDGELHDLFEAAVIDGERDVVAHLEAISARNVAA